MSGESVRKINRQGIRRISNLSELPYEVVSRTLMPRLIAIEGNQEMLEAIPHFIINDMALTYDSETINAEDKSRIVVKITEENLRDWGVSIYRLHDDAAGYASLRRPAKIMRMEECLGDAFPGKLLPPDEGPEMYVATVEGFTFGAAVIMYPGFLDRAERILGGDYFIIPSSVHEMLLMKADGSHREEDLEALVRQVNEYSVIQPERLSNRVVRCSEFRRIYSEKILENCIKERMK